MNKKFVLSADDFFDIVLSSIKAGEKIRIAVSGRSMSPTFRHGVDEIILAPFDQSALAVGDVVLFDRGDQLCVHRIISRDGDRLVIRGDGNGMRSLEYARVSDVKALVVGGSMYGKRREFTIDDPVWKRNTRLVLKYFPYIATWHRLTGLLRRYPLSLLVLCVLLYLSFFDPSTLSAEITIPNIDKVVHAVMYFGVSSVFWFEWMRSHRRPSRRTDLRGMLFCAAFPLVLAVFTEVGQALFSPVRSGEWLDFAANVFGIVLGMIFYYLVTRPVLKRCYARKS